MISYTANNHFPTPLPLVRRLIKPLIVHPGDILLEPSAGSGEIADVLRMEYPTNEVRTIELEPSLRQLLVEKGHDVVGEDFFDYREPVDVIVANPPFMEDFQDIDHFLHGWSILRPGGRMAYIMHKYSAFPKLHSGKPEVFRQFLAMIHAHKRILPRGSFDKAVRPTSTDTCIVWVTKN